jgi:hypothetical protein
LQTLEALLFLNFPQKSGKTETRGDKKKIAEKNMSAD